MHNLDRTLFESGETAGRDGAELEREDFLGILGSLLKGETGGAGEITHEAGLGELTELELASELLEVRDEAELDRFLGALMSRAAGAASDLARSPTGQALGGILKQATKKALPVVGRGLGGWLSPDWAEPGARVGKAAGTLLGLELEGLSGEDREFEIARRSCASSTPPAAGPRPRRPAHPRSPSRRRPSRPRRGSTPGPCLGAPGPGRAGPTGTTGGAAPPGQQATGRWQRQGRTIVIFDV